jgi:hypothetical protein
MKGKAFPLILALLLLTTSNCNNPKITESKPSVYSDVHYLQDYSIKYYSIIPETALNNVAADRNGVIQILSSDGLQKPYNGEFLYPG